MNRIRKLGLGFFLLGTLSTLIAGFAVHNVSAAPDYQYIERVFELGITNDSGVGFTNSVSVEHIAQTLGSGYEDTLNNDGAFRASAIGYNCTGQDEFGPTCEAYFVLNPDETTEESVRFVNYCAVYSVGAQQEAECGHYSTDNLGFQVIAVATTDFSRGTPYGYGGSAQAVINISDPYGAQSAVEDTYGASDSPDNDNNSSDGALDDRTCESKSGAWGWLMCSGIDLIDSSLNWVDSQVQRLLEINQDRYTNPSLKKGWTTFRNIAYIILIPIMLVMVIGTALGFEIFSAYTIKRALPRMVAAVIFITLSWYITTFLISFSNVVGGGVLGLVTSPFRDQAVEGSGCVNEALNLACFFSSDEIGSGGGGLLRNIITSLAAGALALGAIVFAVWIGGTLLLAALGAFITLFVREMFIYILILLAPLAILAWIFPGNDKPWNWWWSFFSKLLIMFPLIMMLLAAGRIFAFIINESPGAGMDGWALLPIMKLIAYILPYALIPFTFKMAGSFLATITGMIDNKQRGLGDRYRNLRNAGLKKFHENAIEEKGRLGADGTKIGKVGSMYRRGAALGRHGSWSLSGAGKQRWGDYKSKHAEAIADKKLEEGGNRSFADDDASELARKKGMTRDLFVEEYLEKLRKSRDVDRRDDLVGKSDEQLKQLAQLALARTEQGVGARVGSTAMRVAAQKYRTALTNTAYEAGEKGLKNLQDDLKELQDEGLITAVDAAGWMKSNRGRTDFSANSFTETIAFASKHRTAKQQMYGADAGAEVREKLGGHQRSVETFAEVARDHAQRVSANFEALAAAEASGATTVTVKDRGFKDVTVEVGAETTQWLQRDADVTTADLNNVHAQLSGTSARKAKVWAEGDPDKGTPGALSAPITYRVKEQVTVEVAGVPELEADGVTQVVRDGEAVWKVPPKTERQWVWKTKTGTGRTMIEDTRHRAVSPDGSDAWYFDRVKEWSTADEAQAGAREAARAAEEAARAAEEAGRKGP